MSTHAASMPLRCRALNAFWKNSSRVSFSRSRRNHSGSPLYRLLAMVRNFCFLPRWISSTPFAAAPVSAALPPRFQIPQHPCSPPAPPAWPPGGPLRSRKLPPHSILEPFAERSLARQLRDLLGLHPAIRTAQAVQLDHHCRAVLKARQVTNFPFTDLGDLAHAPPTTGTNQLPIAGLATHPPPQRFRFFVNLAPIHSVLRPSQNLCPIVVPQNWAL